MTNQTRANLRMGTELDFGNRRVDPFTQVEKRNLILRAQTRNVYIVHERVQKTQFSLGESHDYRPITFLMVFNFMTVVYAHTTGVVKPPS